MVDPRIRNKEIKQEILTNLINIPNRFDALVSILIKKDMLTFDEIKQIYGDDI